MEKIRVVARRAVPMLAWSSAAFIASTGVAAAIDMSAVTGPLPGTVPTSARPCVGPAASPPLMPLTGDRGQSNRPALPAATGADVSGSIAVSQTWTNCTARVAPRSVGGSVEVAFPFGTLPSILQPTRIRQ